MSSRTIRRLAATAAAVATGALAAPAPAAWDPAPIDLTEGVDDSSYEPANVQVAVTPAGAVWTAWFEYDPTNAGKYVVRRVAPDGTVGERREFAGNTISNFFAQDALAVSGNDSVRFAYLLGPGLGGKLAVRTFTPSATSDELVLYDSSTVTNGGRVLGSVQLRGGPGGSTWALWIREDNSVNAAIEARSVDADGQLGAVAALGVGAYAAGAVDDQGNLIVAMTQGGPGRVVAAKVGTDGSVGSATELFPTTASTIAEDVRIGVASGVATVVWIKNTSHRTLQARRLDTPTMTAQGAGATALDDNVPMDYEQQSPVLAVDGVGNALVGWIETDSSNGDTLVRPLAAGDLADAGVVGDRLQLDGPPPSNNWPSGVFATGSDSFVVFRYGFDGCHAVDVGDGTAVASDVPLGSACGFPSAPSDGSAGLAAAWYTNQHYRTQMTRFVTVAPTCSDDAAVAVDHGATVTIPLACDGWRPVPEIVSSPTLGTLAPIDLAARTVAYTAGATAGGADQVRFRATNAAGASNVVAVPVNVTGPPPDSSPPPGSSPPPVDTADRTAPAIARLRVVPRRVRHGSRRALKLTLTLSEAARVTITVRRGAKRVRHVTLNLAGGKRAITIVPGKRTRRLSTGRYRLAVFAVDAAGNRSTTARAAFSVRR
jgi:hypothetical protein